jgi:NDP-sugar pyrophosphorylase family protein
MTQPILLATGEQRHLAPLTDEIAPAMLPVGHQPVMAHVVEWLAAQGLRRLLVSLHYQAASIETYFGQGQRWGVNLEYVVQRDPLGTAGALKWAGRMLSETMVVVPADRLVDFDLQAALYQHRQQGNAASVLVPAPSFQGPIKAPNGAREPVAERHALPPGEVPSRLGIYILEPAVLDLIPPFTPFDIHRQLIPALLQAGLPVGAVAVAGYWNRLASFQDYAAAQKLFMARLASPASEQFFPNVASVRGRQVGQQIWVGRNNAIHPTARLAGPVFIGANCRVGRNVELGPNVVLGANVIIDDEASLSNTVVLDNTYVGKLVKLEQRVARQDLLIDTATASHVHVADAFWLSETHTSVDQSVARRVWDQLLAVMIGACVLPLAAVWALALWLSTGHVFTRKTYLLPTGRAGGNPPGSPAKSLSVLNFYSTATNPVAAWLSRWQARLEWERLPELLSVMAGGLSLVGVKPLTGEEAGQATETWQQAQREFEPGLTGLWYLQTDPDSDLDSVLITDVYYGATRSWRNDMAILWQTPAAWFKRMRRARIGSVVSGSQTEVPLWS